MELTYWTPRPHLTRVFWLVGLTLVGQVLADDVEYSDDDDPDKLQNERLLVQVSDSTAVRIKHEDFITLYSLGMLAGSVLAAILYSSFAVVAKRRYGSNLELWDRNKYKRKGHVSVHRRSSDRVDWDSLKVIDYISMMEEMWRKFDVKEMACQKRVLCELHQNEAALGPAATRIVNTFGYLRYLSLLNLPGEVKSLVDEYLDAADKGRSLKGQTCGQVFDGCEFSIKETFLKHLPSAVEEDHDQLDNHLPE